MRHYLILLICLLCFGGVSAQETLSPYELALQRIQEAERTGATELDLSILGLTELPPEIGNLSNLQNLWLFGNQLISLPAEIGSLNNLQILELSFNQINTLAPEIANLSNLKELYLYSNRLSTLPPEIGNLSQLQQLHVRDNNLSSLPSEIGKLNNLFSLNLGANQLNTLPPEIGKLSNLELFFLRDNQLSSLPPEISNLSKLCYLDISNNHFQHLPNALGQLTYIVNSRTYCIDGSGFLLIDGNPLISPPQEVIDAGTPAILEYLRNEAWWHLQRLILAGASSVGILILVILGLHWKNQRGKVKRKVKAA